MTQFFTSVKASVITSVAIVTLAVAGPAFANTTEDNQLPQAEINIKSADLTSPSVVKQLQAQARRVASQICYSSGDIRDMSQAIAERDCYNTAVRDALAQIETKHEIALAKAGNAQVADQMVHTSVRTER